MNGTKTVHRPNKWQIGDAVSLRKWDETQPEERRLGLCTIVELSGHTSATVLATVRTARGWEACCVDVGWLESPDCTCPILDGVQVTGSSCPAHGLPSFRM